MGGLSESKAELSRSGLLMLFGVLFLTGVLVRWAMLDASSLWYDEGFTWWVASQSPTRIIEIIRADTSPPLYYLLVHYWTAVFGDSVWAMRAESALASTVALGLAIVLSRLVFTATLPRLVAMALLAFSAVQIQYAHDLRCYATATALRHGLSPNAEHIAIGARE